MPRRQRQGFRAGHEKIIPYDPPAPPAALIRVERGIMDRTGHHAPRSKRQLVIAPANWRQSYLSSPAAAHLRVYLDDVQHDLEGAQIARVLARLEGWVWPDKFDRRDLPVTVLEVTGRKIAEAYRYLLERDEDVTSAKDALLDVRALWEVG